MFQILVKHAALDWPGMLGSIDCTHIFWKNCPTAYKGSYTGKSAKPTMVLKIVSDSNLYIWHHCFGTPGSNNDATVFRNSPLVQTLCSDDFNSLSYRIPGDNHLRQGAYYLADGIYPAYSIFVKTVHHPVNAKESLVAKRQESRRKDVERAFGVLKARFRILTRPAEFWYEEDFVSVIKTCIILHNLIVRERLRKGTHWQEEILQVVSDADETENLHYMNEDSENVLIFGHGDQRDQTRSQSELENSFERRYINILNSQMQHKELMRRLADYFYSIN